MPIREHYKSGLDLDVYHHIYYMTNGDKLHHDEDLQYGEINCMINGKRVTPRVYREALGGAATDAKTEDVRPVKHRLGLGGVVGVAAGCSYWEFYRGT